MYPSSQPLHLFASIELHTFTLTRRYVNIHFRTCCCNYFSYPLARVCHLSSLIPQSSTVWISWENTFHLSPTSPSLSHIVMYPSCLGDPHGTQTNPLLPRHTVRIIFIQLFMLMPPPFPETACGFVVLPDSTDPGISPPGVPTIVATCGCGATGVKRGTAVRPKQRCPTPQRNPTGANQNDRIII